MRRGTFVQLVFFALVATAGGLTLALAPAWLPVSASQERDRIDFVFWFVVGICIFIFAVVASAMTYMILRFRARPDDDSDGPPIHGHPGLEIVWTAVPPALVMTQADFERWLNGQKTAAGGSGTGTSNASALGATVFKNNGCNSCHTFKPAGAAGKVGPDLDQLPQEAQRAGKPVDAFAHESIV